MIIIIHVKSNSVPVWPTRILEDFRWYLDIFRYWMPIGQWENIHIYLFLDPL